MLGRVARATLRRAAGRPSYPCLHLAFHGPEIETRESNSSLSTPHPALPTLTSQWVGRSRMSTTSQETTSPSQSSPKEEVSDADSERLDDIAFGDDSPMIERLDDHSSTHENFNHQMNSLRVRGSRERGDFADSGARPSSFDAERDFEHSDQRILSLEFVDLLNSRMVTEQMIETHVKKMLSQRIAFGTRIMSIFLQTTRFNYRHGWTYYLFKRLGDFSAGVNAESFYAVIVALLYFVNPREPIPQAYAAGLEGDDPKTSLIRIIEEQLAEWDPRVLTPRVLTSCIHAYGVVGEWQKALKLLERIDRETGSVDTTMYNCAINVCANNGRYAHAIHLHQQMVKNGVPEDQFTQTAVISVFSSAGRTEDAEKVLKSMIEQGRPLPITVYNMFIKELARKDFERAMAFVGHLHESGVQPDVRTYNTLLTVLIRRNDHERAHLVFLQMLEHGILFSSVTALLMAKVYVSMKATDRLLPLLPHISFHKTWPGLVARMLELLNAEGMYFVVIDLCKELKSKSDGATRALVLDDRRTVYLLYYYLIRAQINVARGVDAYESFIEAIALHDLFFGESPDPGQKLKYDRITRTLAFELRSALQLEGGSDPDSLAGKYYYIMNQLINVKYGSAVTNLSASKQQFFAQRKAGNEKSHTNTSSSTSTSSPSSSYGSHKNKGKIEHVSSSQLIHESPRPRSSYNRGGTGGRSGGSGGSGNSRVGGGITKDNKSLDTGTFDLSDVSASTQPR